MIRNTHRQRGAALIIGLMMLVVITLLAVTAVNTASTELVMAGNEQFRERAFQAADAGVERAVATIDSVPQTATPTTGTGTIASLSGDSFSISTVFTGYEANVANAGEDFVAVHYRITSTGTSLRNASAVIQQGAYVLTSSGNDGYQSWLDGVTAQID
jgi:type IV pilus assembly protein PilX